MASSAPVVPWFDLTWPVPGTDAVVAAAANDDDDVDGVGGTDDAADDDSDDDSEDDDDDRTPLQCSNTAHGSVAAAATTELPFTLSLQPLLLLVFRFISVLCELEKYDVNFFKTPAWALRSLVTLSPSMAAAATAAATAVDDAIDVI